MTEVYINDKLIDISNNQNVVATYGNVKFGELNKRMGAKSNVWKAPFSQRNKLISESCEAVNSDSEIPYQRNDCRVEIDGAAVFQGFCTFESSDDGYEIQSYAGPSDFYSQINNKKLTALDLSAYDHVWGQANIVNSLNNIDGYIYAFVNYGWYNLPFFYDFSVSANIYKIIPDHLIPQIFFHTVIKQIATDAGYTLYGDVLTSERFLKQVIIPNKFPLPISYGGTFQLSTLLPDLPQSKVWLDFACIYGLMFDVNDVEKTIHAIYIDDILFSEPENWDDKVDRSEKTKTTYKIDKLGMTNYLRFNKDSNADYRSCNLDYAKSITLEDTTTTEEYDLYKSEFFMIQNDVSPNSKPRAKTLVIRSGYVFFGIWDPTEFYTLEKWVVWRNGTYYQSTQPSNNKIPGVDTDYWDPVAEKDVWDIKNRPMYGSVVTEIDSPLMIQFSSPVALKKTINAVGLDWETSYNLHYQVFDRLVKKTKCVEMLIKLNPNDITQLDFSRPKKINNELFVLEDVVQFKLNKRDSTICNLIRL